MDKSKNLFASLTAALVLWSLSPVASAGFVYLDGTDLVELGDFDPLMDATKSLTNSSLETELAWVNSVLGTNYTVDQLEKNDEFEWSQDSWALVTVNDSDTPSTEEYGYLFDLSLLDAGTGEVTYPEYFIVKSGCGNGPQYEPDCYEWMLFQNYDNYQFAFIDNVDIVMTSITRISHMTEFGDTQSGDGGDGTDGGDSCNPEDPFDPCEVPEPTTLWLFALALLVTSLYRAAPRATSRKF
jgi:hypothetical protein